MYLGATSETSLSFSSALHYTMPSLSTLIMLSKRRNSKLPTVLLSASERPSLVFQLGRSGAKVPGEGDLILPMPCSCI